jgi:hypothetical protein
MLESTHDVTTVNGCMLHFTQYIYSEYSQVICSNHQKRHQRFFSLFGFAHVVQGCHTIEKGVHQKPEKNPEWDMESMVKFLQQEEIIFLEDC